MVTSDGLQPSGATADSKLSLILTVLALSAVGGMLWFVTSGPQIVRKNPRRRRR